VVAPGCALIGATIELEIPPTPFASDSATIEVDPPEGDRVSGNFDLSSIPKSASSAFYFLLNPNRGVLL